MDGDWVGGVAGGGVDGGIDGGDVGGIDDGEAGGIDGGGEQLNFSEPSHVPSSVV